jgi:hypothetical protein
MKDLEGTNLPGKLIPRELPHDNQINILCLFLLILGIRRINKGTGYFFESPNNIHEDTFHTLGFV